MAGRPVSDAGRETSVVCAPGKPRPNEAPIDGGGLSLLVSVSAEEAAVEEAAEESPLPDNDKEGRTPPASAVGVTVGCAIGD